MEFPQPSHSWPCAYDSSHLPPAPPSGPPPVTQVHIYVHTLKYGMKYPLAVNYYVYHLRDSVFYRNIVIHKCMRVHANTQAKTKTNIIYNKLQSVGRWPRCTLACLIVTDQHSTYRLQASKRVQKLLKSVSEAGLKCLLIDGHKTLALDMHNTVIVIKQQCVNKLRVNT